MKYINIYKIEYLYLCLMKYLTKLLNMNNAIEQSSVKSQVEQNKWHYILKFNILIWIGMSSACEHATSADTTC